MPTVQLPNGKTASFPDGMSPQDIQTAIESDPSTGALPGVPKAPTVDVKPLGALDAGGGWSPDDLWRGAVSGVKNMVMHPINTAAGMAEPFLASGVAPGGMYPTTAATGRQQDSQANQSVQGAAQQDQTQQAKSIKANPAYTVGGVVGPALVTAGAAKIPEMVGNSLTSLAPKVANIAMGATPDPYGGDPGAAAVKEGAWGFSPQSILADAKRNIPSAASAHRATLYAAEPTTVDIGDAVTSPFNDVRSAKLNPRTGAATPPQIAKLNRTQNLLTHEQNGAGQPTTALRPLNQYTPLQANDLKSNIYGMTDYDSPTKGALANDALKQSAHNIKNTISTAVPESIPSGNRLHNLMALKELMQSKAPTGIPTSKGGLLGNAVMGGGTLGAIALDRVGNIVRSFPTGRAGVVPPVRASLYDSER